MLRVRGPDRPSLPAAWSISPHFPLVFHKRCITIRIIMDRGCYIKSMIYSERTELVLVEVGSIISLRAGITRHAVPLFPRGAFIPINLNTFLSGHVSISGLLFLITENDSLPSKTAFFSASVWQDNSRACCCPPRHKSAWEVRYRVYSTLAARRMSGNEENKCKKWSTKYRFPP